MYSVKYHKQVVKFLQKQEKSFRAQVIDIFDSLKQNPKNYEQYDIKSLKGFKNKYRLRIGKYRIIYSLLDDKLIIEVIKAGSRGDVYK